MAGAGDDVPVPDLRVGLVNLPVSTERQELTISVTPDKPQAGPRDKVTYTVKTTDYSGKGVRAEVSLALVDKAVLALADDPNPTLMRAFYENIIAGQDIAEALARAKSVAMQQLGPEAIPTVSAFQVVGLGDHRMTSKGAPQRSVNDQRR